MHNFLLQVFDYLNTIILIYFIITNGTYTVLMVLSLYTVTLHSRYAARRSYYSQMADSPVTPPVALVVPAFNEQDAIVATVLSLMDLNYPEKEIIVVDDGSTDYTMQALIERFELLKMDLIYRPVLKAKPITGVYHNPRYPELIVISKENGGKPDAVNVGINMARSSYFCTVDADSIVERDALLRLIAPILQSSVNTVVSGGVVRIANGCTLKDGRITAIDLPGTWLERCQVVEYIRTFLFGRPAWSFLNATFITSGAFCLLHKESVIAVGGLSTDTVTEDIDLVATLHKHLRQKKWKYRMVFTTDPICWTECPHSIGMFARQRRRWQLGLIQTVMKHDDMIFNPRYGGLGMLSIPFHAYIEAVGCLIEAMGTILVPFSFLIGAMPLALFMLIMALAVGYGTMLSLGSVLLEETTVRRYPGVRHLLILIAFAVIENFGYRQMVSLFRAQGVMRYVTGLHKWETVVHKGVQGNMALAEHES
jgi:cellulose synthase/poly-beta-1,6-N-acetylglucosamine synthase-like glycosyltransferase